MGLIEGGKYPRLGFQLEQGFSCCGQGIIYDIMEKHREHWNEPAKGYTTLKERNEAFLASVYSELEEGAEAWNDALYEDDDKLDHLYAFCNLTLYRGQHTGLIEFLEEKGWKILQEGMNPKTGNTIVNMGVDLK